jgi:hypothetical protein
MQTRARRNIAWTFILFGALLPLASAQQTIEGFWRSHLHGSLKKFCNGQVEYGHIDPATGYLRIISFSGYSKQGDFASGSAALQSALDEIFSDSALRALVKAYSPMSSAAGSPTVGLSVSRTKSI